MPARKRSRAERAVPLPRDWVVPPMPSLPGLQVASLTQVFDELAVSAAIWLRDPWWQAIHVVVPSLQLLESELGVDIQRKRYDGHCLAQAVRQARPVVGEFRGFSDLFVPMLANQKVEGVLVTGSFARARPTSTEIRERWLEMTGSHGRLGDPTFYRYVTLSLNALTLEGSLLSSFQGLMTCFAMLASGVGDPDALGAQAATHRHELRAARLAERMWITTRRAVDEEALQNAGVVDHGILAPFGVDRIPQGVVVGLLTPLSEQIDAVEERVRTDAFLRATGELARRRGGILVGPVGHNGVVLLTDSDTPRAKTSSVDLIQRTTALARRFGFALHAGIADESRAEPLPTRYLAALRAAEKALSEGQNLVRAESAPRPTLARLRRLRGDLGRAVAQGPKAISARFEEYVQAVLAHSGYRIEPVRTHLDAGFERLTEPVASDGLLDEKSLSELWASIERAADAARTVAALTEAYRRIVDDLGHGLQSPTHARRDRSMRRAVSFIREHLGEPLPLDRVARAAGFAPKYFSQLFHDSEGLPFATYVHDLRIARAKELLKLSRLSVDRVGRSCGFRTRTHFHRAFRQSVGVTPMEYRTS